MDLYNHQAEALKLTKDKTHVAYYHDMGLGKTFTGAQKMIELGETVNLVICQKSKIDDWYDHFDQNYWIAVFDLTDKQCLDDFLEYNGQKVGIINYDLVFRRPGIKKLKDFTLMLDESSLIKNENSKRSKFILGLKPKNVVLLSGTPVGGKYEELWSQMKLLGWEIDRKIFFNQYVDYHYEKDEGFPRLVIDGYKNVERLKRKMREHGCHFVKTEEVFDLPDQTFQKIKVEPSKEYKTFRKKRIITVDFEELVGDTALTKMLYERQLCGQYNKEKLGAFKDLVESTNDRLIVFYNFTYEMENMKKILLEEDEEYYSHVFSTVNGLIKDLDNYEKRSDSITFVQYQAGAMGLNLQKANKIIYFTPPLSSDLFEQSKKRIHRIGQNRPCFYYELVCKHSIEEKIYSVLKSRKDYTEALFEKDEKSY